MPKISQIVKQVLDLMTHLNYLENDLVRLILFDLDHAFLLAVRLVVLDVSVSTTENLQVLCSQNLTCVQLSDLGREVQRGEII